MHSVLCCNDFLWACRDTTFAIPSICYPTGQIIDTAVQLFAGPMATIRTDFVNMFRVLVRKQDIWLNLTMYACRT